jgi:hypothetical protein
MGNMNCCKAKVDDNVIEHKIISDDDIQPYQLNNNDHDHIEHFKGGNKQFHSGLEYGSSSLTPHNGYKNRNHDLGQINEDIEGVERIKGGNQNYDINDPRNKVILNFKKLISNINLHYYRLNLMKHK